MHSHAKRTDLEGADPKFVHIQLCDLRSLTSSGPDELNVKMETSTTFTGKILSWEEQQV